MAKNKTSIVHFDSGGRPTEKNDNERYQVTHQSNTIKEGETKCLNKKK